MKIIGITGGIGAGKSTVSSEFEKYGAKIVDADKIAKGVSAMNGAAYDEIISAFGEMILEDNGEINRKKLADIVFSDNEKLKQLNMITHKHIFMQMEKEIANSQSDIVILDVPLLFSSDFEIDCDIKIVVTADMTKRINRVIKRDNTDEESVRKRIAAQLDDETMIKLADAVIVNDNIDEMKKQIEEIVNSIRGKEIK